jgi:RHS repeat-associated protein
MLTLASLVVRELYAQTEADCYNPNDTGYYCVLPNPCEGCPDEIFYQYEYFYVDELEDAPYGSICVSTGSNPVNIGSSSVQREVRDLTVLGGVGRHRLAWSRYGHSRLVTASREFGDGHVWRHSYQWDIASPAAGKLKVTYPTGTSYTYTLSNGVWTSSGTNPDVMWNSGNDYYIRRQDSSLIHFQKVTAGSAVFYQVRYMRDPYNNQYNLTYDANRRLVLVTEPGGRWLRITYTAVTVNTSQFGLLANTMTNPPKGRWTEVTVTNPQAYRYLRYYSTDPGSNGSYCNIGEIEFYDTNGIKLTGTPFGTPSSQGLADRTFDKAFDGNTATFFDNATAHFGFTGIDLGEGNERVISKVRFYPRDGYANRINGTNGEGMPRGCRFEGANEAPMTVTVVGKVEAGYGSGAAEVVTRTVDYHYTAKPDPVLESDWVTLTGVSYGDGTQATYQYHSLYAGQRPILQTANDPRVEGVATRIQYEFWLNAGVYGQFFREMNPLNGQVLTTLEGDGTGKRKITDSRGGLTRMTLLSDFRPSEMTDRLGRRTTYAWGANNAGFLSARTDALNRTTTFTRDARGRVLSVTRPDGKTKSWTRDNIGLLLSQTDEQGRVTQLTRDANRRIVRVDHPDGTYEAFTRNSHGQVLTHRHRTGATVTSVYDTRGRLTSRTDGEGKTTAYTYNDVTDLLATVTDPAGRVTTVQHNERGQVTGVTHADGTSVARTYDAYGNMTQYADEAGKVSTWTYDEFKRPLTATDPLNRTTTFLYAADGAGCCGGSGGGGERAPTLITLPSGKMIHRVYDAEWQLSSETVGFGTAAAATTEYGYNADGTLARVTNPLGKVWTATYDARRRLQSVTDPMANRTEWTYDGVGNALTTKWPDLTVSTQTYDAMNRMLTSTDPKNQTTSLAYNDVARTVTLTDGRGKNTRFEFDARGLRTRKVFHDGSAEQWSYDSAGQATTYTTVAGQVATVTRDDRHRVTALDWSDGTPDVTAAYDTRGRLVSLNNGISALNYAYDDAGQLTGETQDINSPVDLPAKTVGYSYDQDGNRASLTYPGGTVITYGYTSRNQLASVSADGPPPLAAYEYDLAGRRTAKHLENGTLTESVYDDADRLLQLTHRKTGVAAPLQQFDYTLNAMGNRKSRVESNFGAPVQRDVYGYDAVDQLVDVKYGADDVANPTAFTRQTGYDYDAGDNRASVTEDADGTGAGAPVTTAYTANDLNQYTSIGLVLAPVHDLNGNTVQLQARAAGPIWTYQYDAQNRLVGGTSSTGDTFTFAYDARNRCVMRNINGTVTVNLYNGWSLIEERSGGDVIKAKHIHGAALDEILCTIRDESGTSTTAFHHHDGLGSVTALTDSSAILVERYAYDVYGKPTILSGANLLLGASAAGNRFMFTAREWFAALELSDHRHRYYQPGHGRWLSRDPIEEEGGVNLYTYVTNNSLGLDDLDGLSPAYADMSALPNYTGPSIFSKPGISNLPERLSNCIAKCVLEHYGLATVGAGLVVSGAPVIPKKWVYGKGKDGTSVASIVCREVFPQRIKSFPAPTLRGLSMRSGVLGGVIGRWIPFVGLGLLVIDGVAISFCVEKCMREDGNECTK